MLPRRIISSSLLSTLCRRRWLSSQYVFRDATYPKLTVVPRYRGLSTPAPHVTQSAISNATYQQLADVTMEVLLESLENLLDEEGLDGYEVEYSSGVLTLTLGEHGTYVINKQPPNKQIWLSSPLSGPKRYDYSESEDDWRYARDDHAMGDLLNEELSRVFGQKVDLKVSEISRYTS